MARVLASIITAAAISILIASQTQHAAANNKLQIQLTPSVTMAPASVRVRVLVEHDADNRELEIVADSGLFYRRTVVELDGDRAPKVNDLRLSGIPGGDYDITATLTTARGERLAAHETLKVLGGSLR